MNQMTMNQLKEEVHQMKKKEEASASLQLSVTRSGTKYQISVGTKEDVQKVPVNLMRSIFANAPTIDPLKMEKSTAQLSTNTNAAQAVANAAAVEAAAGVSHDLHAAAKKAAASAAAPERVAAEAAATVNNMCGEINHLQLLLTTERAIFHAAPERAIAVQAVIDPFKRVAIKADAEAAAMVNNMRGEIKRLQLLLATEQAAAADARAAANEAAATINRLEEENKRMASSNPVPVFANEPPWKEHIQSQPGATIAKSNPATYAQAVTNSEPSLSSTMKRSTRAQDIDRDRSANAASASATADPASAIMMSPTVLQHNLADHAKAAALQAAADAAAAAATDPKILRAVLLAAAATANALASTIPLDAVPTHRRGGRPPKTRRANPRPRPRRTRRPTGMHTGAPAPTADSTSTARQSSQHSAFADCPPRAGQARPQPGARPPRFDSTRSTTLATRQILPKVEPTVMRLNGRD